jgi:hypothetical protein
MLVRRPEPRFVRARARALLLLVVLGSLPCRTALAEDAAGARAQLKLGFDLKEQHRYAEALPHLTESLRLDPSQIKTLINLADCEEQLGMLASAVEHWVRARDRAAADGSGAFRALAERRLAAVEKRMPKLTVRLERATAQDVKVDRDGEPLSEVSLGMPLPVDPGKHVVRVRAAGTQDHVYDATLAEGEERELVVTPGAASSAPPSPLASAASAPPGASASESPVAPQPAEKSPSNVQQTLGYFTTAAGVVGIGISAFFGIRAKSLNDASYADDHCDASGCDATGKDLRNQAFRTGDAATVAFVAGALVLGGGVALVLTAPRTGQVGARISAAPLVGRGSGGASLSTVF